MSVFLGELKNNFRVLQSWAEKGLQIHAQGFLKQQFDGLPTRQIHSHGDMPQNIVAQKVLI